MRLKVLNAVITAAVVLALIVQPVAAQGGWRIADADWLLEQNPDNPTQCRYVSILPSGDHPGFEILKHVPESTPRRFFSVHVRDQPTQWLTEWFPCPPGVTIGSTVRTTAGSTGSLLSVANAAVCSESACTWTLPAVPGRVTSAEPILDLSLGGLVLLVVALLLAALLFFGTRRRTA